MNFQQLEYIIAVDQQKHFGKAAAQCFVTQATLSAMVKKLEQELNIRIFDRKKQPTLTTEIGKTIVAHAKELINKRDELILKSQEEQTLRGSIRLGIIPTVASTLLPIILPKLLKRFPDLKLNVTEVSTDEMLGMLETNQLDLGILATPTKQPNINEEILYYESMLIYGAQEIKKKTLRTQDLSQSRMWLLEEGNCFRNQSISLCDIKLLQSQDNQLELESSSFDTLINLTDKFGGFTLIPELYFKTLSASKKKSVKHFAKPFPVREISLAYARPYALQNTVKQIAELIREFIPPHLQTTKFKAQDLSILGI